VSGIYPFMWCLDHLAKCDDSANPKDEFYSIGGDTLQLSGGIHRDGEGDSQSLAGFALLGTRKTTAPPTPI